MPIETQCVGCGRTLRVADEHAGKQARCPMCNTIYTVPAATESPANPSYSPSESLPSESFWELKREENVYGPVSKADLDRWVAEGRVDANSLLRETPHGDWQPAGKHYPALLQRKPKNPFADLDVEPSAGHGYGYGYGGTPANVAPHRGGMILAFGILGWLICPVFGVLAWALAAADLRQMRNGQMDPSGRGLTQAGMILGILNVAVIGCFALPLLFVWGAVQ